MGAQAIDDREPRGEHTIWPERVRSPYEQDSDITAAQLRRLEKRSRERRRVTPQALALRVAAVANARRAGDKWATIGALEDLASAALAWASFIRRTSQL